MSDQWVVFELSHHGEKLTRSELNDLLVTELSDGAEFFIPTVTFTRRDTEMSVCLMEGYFFVRAGLPVTTYFALEDQPFVQRILTQDESSNRFICYVDDEVVGELKAKLQQQAARTIQEGDLVRVLEGAYSNLTGEIIDVFADTERATIHIVGLQSMEIIVELPFQFFEHTDEVQE